MICRRRYILRGRRTDFDFASVPKLPSRKIPLPSPRESAAPRRASGLPVETRCVDGRLHQSSHFKQTSSRRVDLHLIQLRCFLIGFAKQNEQSLSQQVRHQFVTIRKEAMRTQTIHMKSILEFTEIMMSGQCCRTRSTIR